MAIYLVSNLGDGTDDGAANTMNPTATDWGKAEPTLAGALLLALVAGDILLIDSSHQESGTAYVASTTVRLVVYVVDKDNSNALDTLENGGGFFKATTTGAATVSWGVGTYVYGFNLVHAGTGSRAMSLGSGASPSVIYEASRFAFENNGMTGTMSFGNADQPSKLILKDCKLVTGNASNRFIVQSQAILQNCTYSVNTSGAAPARFFNFGGTDPGGASLECFGCDLSALGANPLVGGTQTANGLASFIQCKFGSGYMMMETGGLPNAPAGAAVQIFDCASDSTHTEFAYQDRLGMLICDSVIKFTGGAAGLSWRITTTSICNQFSPFVTPWINLYNTGTGAITPRLEIHRDNNATPWQNDEVWGEFSAKVTSGSTRATVYSDRMALTNPPSSPADQSAGTDTWDADNATHWSGKVNTTSTITPAENGHIRARVLVGIPLDGTSGNILRVDPQIRT